MKNLFKNLMLVAVAAMAFTACSQDVNEVNKVEKKTVISGVLGFDEGTRSGFVGTETTDNGDGTTTTVYKSAWEDGDTIKFFADNGLETTATIDAEGKFTAQFEGELPESFYMTVCSPAESWSSKDYSTIPAEQTPLANSVDPVAHILKAQNVYVTNGSADVVNMGHQVAYGKMTVNGVAFEIDHVVVNLKGTYYMDYERECTYTINADNVQNNVFWFTTETFENVTEFTVTAYDAEGLAVAKTVDVAAAGKTLAFNYGRVSTFSVSGLEVPAPTYPVFTSASLTNGNYSDKLIKFTGKNIDMSLNFSYCNTENFLDLGEYTIENKGSGPWKIYGAYSTTWCIYHDAQGNEYGMNGGTVKVNVSNGNYVIEWENIQLINGNIAVVGTLPYAKFTGEITNLILPDSRIKLAAPSDIQTSVSGKTITITWSAVTGADGYRVKLYSPHDEYFEEVVTGTEYVYNAELANTTYSFTIMSYAKDDNTGYRSSDDDYVYVTTEDTDPKMEVSVESLKFKAAGETKEFTVTLKNFTADITVSHGDNEWLTLTPNGNVISVSVDANDVAEKRYDTIVVTAGEFTKEIPVEQAAMKTEGANSNIFTQCKCVNNMDMGEGWGAKFELSNDEGLFLWLWVIQTSVNQSTGAIATGTYNFHNQWCDRATQPGFVVKKMRFPGSDEEIYITNATMKATLNGTANDLEFGITLEDGTTETYTFSGTVVRAW